MTVSGAGSWPAGGRWDDQGRTGQQEVVDSSPEGSEPWPGPQWSPAGGPGDPEQWATGDHLPVPESPADGTSGAVPPPPPPPITPQEAGIFSARSFAARTYDARSGSSTLVPDPAWPPEPATEPWPEQAATEVGWELEPYRPRWPEPVHNGGPPAPPNFHGDDPAGHGGGRHAAGASGQTGMNELPPGTLPHPTRAVRRRRQRRRRLLEWPFLIAFSLVAAVVVRTFVFQTFYIPSGSMHDTLLEGDQVLVNKLSYDLHDVNRGDVVVFRRPENLHIEEEDLIKRVVGLPGETIEAHDGRVYINSKGLNEPYVQSDCDGTSDFPPVSVPSDKVFVMGDNRCNSTDSREFGPISVDLLVGRAVARIWPPSRVGWL